MSAVSILVAIIAAMPPPGPNIWAAQTIGCSYETRIAGSWSTEGLATQTTKLAAPIIRLYVEIDSLKGTAKRRQDQLLPDVIVRQSVLGLYIDDPSDDMFGVTTTIYDISDTRSLRPGYFAAVRTTHVRAEGKLQPAQEIGWCRVVK